MTDRDLATALQDAEGVEALARAQWEASAKALDNQERESAVLVMRHAIALKRSLEQWMVARSSRAAFVR